MANDRWYVKNLGDFLYPRGNVTNPNSPQPNVIPDVLDSEGNAIFFTDPRRFVTQVSVVDVGDSPNSNTGDPLRTAFVKIDNIVEALYRNDAAKAWRLAQMESPGRFLGMMDYEDLPLPPLESVADFTVTPQAHQYPQNGDWAILRNVISSDVSPVAQTFAQRYPFVYTGPGSAVNATTFTTSIRVNSYSVLRWLNQVTTPAGVVIDLQVDNYQPGQWVVVQQQTLDDFAFNIDQGLTRLATGTANWYNYDSENGPVAQQQRELFERFNDQSAVNIDSKRLRSRNIEDAITELVARSTINQVDAGYYG